MRVLVTGASGFVGRAVLAQLNRRGLDVVAVGRRTRAPVAGEQVRVLDAPGDPLAVQALMRSAEPEVVIHLAGTSTFKSYAELYAANVVFAANLLDAALALRSPPAMLLTGSAAEYGPVPADQQPVGEHFPCRPNTAYGVSKLAQTAQGAVARMRGLPVTIARPFNPIGAGMPETLALGSFARQIVRMGKQGGVLSTGDLEVVRDFIDVDAAANLMVELALSHSGEVDVVNICTGHGQRLLDLTRRLIELAGTPVELRQDLSRRGNSDVRAFVGDPARLQALGFEPQVLDVDTLLNKILQSAEDESS